MATIGVVIIDAHQDLTDTQQNNINSIIDAAEKSDRPLFYVLPEGEEISETVTTEHAHSKLYYDPDREDVDVYTQARIDEQIAGRDIDRVQFYGPGTKPGDFSQKCKNRGRETYAASPARSEKPEWAAK